MSETRATEVRDAMNLVARAAEHVAEYVYQDDADSVLLREAIRILRGAVASPGPTESDRRDTERLDWLQTQVIPPLSVREYIDEQIRLGAPPFGSVASWYASVGSSNATEEGDTNG